MPVRERKKIQELLRKELNHMAKKSEYKESVNIAAVERALRVMETIRHEGREMGIKEIADKIGEYPSTIYRVISTLMNHGYLYQNPETSRYGLGFKVYMMGTNLEKNSSLIRIARSYAEEIAARYHECVNVGVRDESRTDGYYAMTIHQVRGSKRSLSVTESVGETYPCYYSSIGKALLAFSEDLDYPTLRRSELKQYTPYTITDGDKLIREIETIRKQGYAIDDQEQELGLCCVGCPVLNSDGIAVMAISVSGFEGNIKAIGYDVLAEDLKKACNEMSLQIR